MTSGDGRIINCPLITRGRAPCFHRQPPSMCGPVGQPGNGEALVGVELPFSTIPLIVI